MRHFLKHERSTWSRIWGVGILASMVVHLLGFLTVNKMRLKGSAHSAAKMVKIKAVDVSKLSEPKPAERMPKKQKPNKEKPPTKQAPQRDQIQKIVQGVSKESLVETGTMAAPLGNSLAVPDVGDRVKEISGSSQDLSSDARIIPETLKIPAYTPEAEDAGIEGVFIVDVYINADGTVREAELRRRINYGMDSRVLRSIKDAKFIPRKNKLGVSEEGWTEFKFRLVIP